MLETSFSRAYEALSHDRNAPVSGITLPISRRPGPKDPAFLFLYALSGSV
jgi:hypothetical protein